MNEDWTVEALSNQTRLLNGDDCFDSQHSLCLALRIFTHGSSDYVFL